MNKYLLLGLGVVIVAAIGFYLYGSSEVTYVAAIDSEIDQLETELMELEAAIADGSLTPEEAVEAQAKIVARLDAINTKTSTAGKAELTASQKLMLENGLDRLKNILTTYQSTLVAVDTAVETAPDEVKARLNVRGSTSATKRIAAIIEVLEEHADEVIEDFVPEEDGLSDEILEEEPLGSDEEGSMSDEDSDTEEVSTTTDETTPEEDESPEESTDTDDDETSLEMSSEETVTTEGEEEDPTSN